MRIIHQKFAECFGRNNKKKNSKEKKFNNPGIVVFPTVIISKVQQYLNA